MSSSTSAMATTLGLSKVFILDKYFSELQKFWETEKRLQGRECVNFQLITPSWHVVSVASCGMCRIPCL